MDVGYCMIFSVICIVLYGLFHVLLIGGSVIAGVICGIYDVLKCVINNEPPFSYTEWWKEYKNRHFPSLSEA